MSRPLSPTSPSSPSPNSPFIPTDGSFTPMSPRGLGVNSLQSSIDLDEIEYTAPIGGGDYWLRSWDCWRQPRVRQFCRWKFLAIIATLVCTGVFLAATITLMTIPPRPDEVILAPSEIASDDQECAIWTTWEKGSILIRNPFDLRNLTTINTSTSKLLQVYNMSEWDYITAFDGSFIRAYGRSTELVDTDTGFGSIGAPDIIRRSNSWGILMDEYHVSTPDVWYESESIDLRPWIEAATTSADGGSGTESSGHNSSSPSLSTVSSSTGANVEPIDRLDTKRFYLFNNRTDVHLYAYRLATPSIAPSTNTSNTADPNVSSAPFESFASIPSTHSNHIVRSFATVLDPNLYPYWTLRLRLMSDLTLRMCGHRFVMPTNTPTTNSSTT